MGFVYEWTDCEHYGSIHWHRCHSSREAAIIQIINTASQDLKKNGKNQLK